MSVWDFFDRKTCLALDADWPTVCQEFERVGLWGVEPQQFAGVGLSDVIRFRPFEIDNDKILGPHQSFNASVRQMLIDFLATDARSMLSMEGDIVFRDLSHLQDALNELPENWDVLYLGANLLNGQPERYSPHLCRVFSAWTTHAIAYNRKVVQFILDNQPGISEEMVDNFLGKQLPNLKAYCVTPMVAYQKPHQSGIWGKPGVDDYTDIFEASDEKLRLC